MWRSILLTSITDPLCYRHSPQNIPRKYVVDVNSQSANSKNFLLLFDWMLTMTTFVPWDILWAMVMSLPIHG